MDKSITVKEIIRYFGHRNEHYPISDLYLYKYKQESKGYRELESEFTSNKILKDDKFFFESELIQMIQKYEPLRCFLIPQTGATNPSQKWHLLVSYYLYAELKTLETQNYDIRSIEDFEPMDWYFRKQSPYKCPELCLWMVEATMDNVILTSEDVYELFYKAVEYRSMENKMSWDCFPWWKENKKGYWDKMMQIIARTIKCY